MFIEINIKFRYEIDTDDKIENIDSDFKQELKYSIQSGLDNGIDVYSHELEREINLYSFDNLEILDVEIKK